MAPRCEDTSGQRLIKSGYTSNVYELENGLIKHYFETEREAPYRVRYRDLTSSLGISVPDVVDWGTTDGGSYILSVPAEGVQISEDAVLWNNPDVVSEYWSILNSFHEINANLAGRSMEMSSKEYIDHRFGTVDGDYPSYLLDDEIVLCHRDLNPSNLFWDGHSMTVIDFGSTEFAPRHYDLAIHTNFSSRYGIGSIDIYEHDINHTILNQWRIFDAVRKIQWANSKDSPMREIVDDNKEILDTLGYTYEN